MKQKKKKIFLEINKKKWKYLLIIFNYYKIIKIIF